MCMTCIRGLRGIPSTQSSHDAGRTLRWRRLQLMAAGLDELSAHRLAARSDVDLHALLTLCDTEKTSLLEQVEGTSQDSPHA
jgi:hypothetical protein